MEPRDTGDRSAGSEASRLPTLSWQEKLRLFAKYHLKRRPARGPEPERELGVVELDFQLEQYYAALRELDSHFDVDEAASVTYRSIRYPLYALQSRAAPDGARLAVLAGVHGNEHAGLLAVPPLLREMVDQPERYGGINLLVIAPVNPVGAAHRSRYNGDGLDINRDFRRFQTAEAAGVRERLERFGPRVIVSLHEGPHDATFVFANRAADEKLGAAVVESLRRHGCALAERDYFGRTLEVPGLAPEGPIETVLTKLWGLVLGMAPTSAYADRLGIAELTVESSWAAGDADARIGAQLAAVRGAVDYLVGGSR